MLATDLRPQNLDDFIGQKHLVGKNMSIRKMIESNDISSMVFWGPAGCGKTTLARIISKQVDAEFFELNAVSEGKEALKKIVEQARQNFEYHKKNILFIDEIHRWSRSQQDALLSYVENNLIILIGATTENPSFSIISPLLSRARVFVFQPLTIAELSESLKKGAERLGVKISDEVIAKIAAISDGDARFALNTLELAYKLSDKSEITENHLKSAVQRSIRYDKNGEEHYNIISAVHKSLRSSNASAAAYWISRMLAGGEDPLYIARRLIRFASEDIGNANPNALLLANQVFLACQNIGMPECEVALIQLADYLANSPKSNKAYVAMNRIKEDVAKFGSLAVPMHIRNAPTKLMKDLGYGKGYEYDHDLKSGKSKQKLLPDELEGRDYFA